MKTLHTTIYSLSDPRTQSIVYVGKTQRLLSERVCEHRKSPNRKRAQCSPDLTAWIIDLKEQGIHLTGEVLEECDPAVGEEREVYWVAQCRAWGFPILNKTDGGPGMTGWKHTEETLAKIKSTKTRNGTGLGHKGYGGRPKGHLSQSIQVVHLPTGTIYPSLKHAARETGFGYSCLRERITGRARAHLNEYAFLGDQNPNFIRKDRR